ncbi:hypothetical protein B0T24DRAFT_681823 [Lasiosphaeria ovina]|uniref:Uncharacterized protein n=1 Tax=Lasiosphaeria ovina TaxID=92902 RepID=A0AAE0JYC6_9PEZI|nr:hypothetical protein B0T24DRAFT_681823 [Lasiosphaeria ovina]
MQKLTRSPSPPTPLSPASHPPKAFSIPVPDVRQDGLPMDPAWYSGSNNHNRPPVGPGLQLGNETPEIGENRAPSPSHYMRKALSIFMENYYGKIRDLFVLAVSKKIADSADRVDEEDERKAREEAQSLSAAREEAQRDSLGEEAESLFFKEEEAEADRDAEREAYEVWVREETVHMAREEAERLELEEAIRVALRLDESNFFTEEA